MEKMSKADFERAEMFICEHGRELDQAVFQHHFRAGSSTDVLECLEAFQNPDGGFGHGLEPDLRAPASSAIATTHGFEILRDVSAPTDEPMVRRAIDYLLNEYDEERGVWPIIPAQAEAAAHAPWWTYAESDKNFGGFTLNPRAAIAGYLWDYAELVPNTMLEQVTQAVLSTAASIPGEIGMHDLLCVITLAESKNLPDQYGGKLMARLEKSIPDVVEDDPARWTGYCLRPLDVARAPGALLATVVGRKPIDAHLDYLLETQLDDGSWPLAWSWEEIDAEAWRQAEQDWKGYHAVHNLRTLCAYGRIVA